jgi:BirA family biotin operon repressor/biotin-[acetyl-CoA-carboxylase] ligase
VSTRGKLVDLLATGEEFISGAELARRLGISRNAVWKHVEVLRGEGWDVETRHARGYRIVGRPDGMDADAVTKLLATRVFGRRLVCLASTGSTSNDAAALAREGAPEGAAVIADTQTAGRGRLGRTWASARGVNLYMSVLLRPNVPPAAAPQLSLVAGLAVARSLEGEGLDPRIKWPNDVLLDGRKVCGILTELEAEADRVAFVVVGIGVNLNSRLDHFPPELHDKATSVLLATGRMVSRAAFTARLLAELERCYGRYIEAGFGVLADDWNARSALTGRTVTVAGAAREAVTGRCTGIDADGALLVAGGAGVHRVLAGDVTIVGGYDA